MKAEQTYAEMRAERLEKAGLSGPGTQRLKRARAKVCILAYAHWCATSISGPFARRARAAYGCSHIASGDYYQHVAEYVGCSEGTLMKALRELCAEGLLINTGGRRREGGVYAYWTEGYRLEQEGKQAEGLEAYNAYQAKVKERQEAMQAQCRRIQRVFDILNVDVKVTWHTHGSLQGHPTGIIPLSGENIAHVAAALERALR